MAVKLLIVDHAVDLGGAERVLLSFLERVDRKTVDPALACPHEGPLVSRASDLGVMTHLGHPSAGLLGIRRDSVGAALPRAALYPLELASTVVRLARLIAREGFEVVMTNSAKAHVYGTLAARAVGRPAVVRLHDIVSPADFSRLNVFLLGRVAGRLARRVLAVSRAVRDQAVSIGVPDGKLLVVHNGIDVGAAAQEAERRAVRASLGIGPDEKVAVMIGRLVPWKGPDVFIKAAALVAREVPDTRFLLVGDAIFGDGDYVSGLKDLARSLGLGPRVLFTGFRNDVSDLLAASDVAVHCSVRPEPFGMVLLEAMSCRRPVVAAAAGGVSEVVEDGVTGTLVPPGDEKAFAREIARLLENPSGCGEMGGAGRRRAAAEFSTDVCASKLTAQLVACATGGGA